MEPAAGPRQSLFCEDIFVRPEELTVGTVYFWVGYEDDNLTIPMVRPMRYLGASPGDESAAHDFEPLSEPDEVHGYRSDQLSWIHTFEGMLTELDRCRQRRSHGRG